ncbi:unnamed protein product, partial [Prorocentrum cordatum]
RCIAGASPVHRRCIGDLVRPPGPVCSDPIKGASYARAFTCQGPRRQGGSVLQPARCCLPCPLPSPQQGRPGLAVPVVLPVPEDGSSPAKQVSKRITSKRPAVQRHRCSSEELTLGNSHSSPSVSTPSRTPRPARASSRSNAAEHPSVMSWVRDIGRDHSFRYIPFAAWGRQIRPWQGSDRVVDRVVCVPRGAFKIWDAARCCRKLAVQPAVPVGHPA